MPEFEKRFKRPKEMDDEEFRTFFEEERELRMAVVREKRNAVRQGIITQRRIVRDFTTAFMCGNCSLENMLKAEDTLKAYEREEKRLAELFQQFFGTEI